MQVSKQHLEDLIAANGFIPEHLIGEYLKDKITTKPNYGFDTEAPSQVEEIKAAMASRERFQAGEQARNKQSSNGRKQ